MIIALASCATTPYINANGQGIRARRGTCQAYFLGMTILLCLRHIAESRGIVTERANLRAAASTYEHPPETTCVNFAAVTGRLESLLARGSNAFPPERSLGKISMEPRHSNR